MVLGMSVSNFGPQVEYKGEGLEIVVDSDLDPDEKLSNILNSFVVQFYENKNVPKNAPASKL